jgi:glycosyltransferase involved in cell wall biosynthesis
MKIWMPSIHAGTGSDIFVKRLSHDLSAKNHDAIATWYPHAFEIFPFPLKGIRPPPSTDIIHANSWSAFAFSRPGIPLVVTMHHLVHDPAYAPNRSLAQAAYHKTLIYNYERLGMKAASKVVAVSKYTAKVTATQFPNADVVTIPNGIDTRLFCPASGELPSSGKFRILYVGTATYRKGFDLLARIMEKLGPDYWLSYTSNTKPGPGVMSNSTSLGKMNSAELVKAYQNCDAFIFPSRYEGFGYAVAEAMACGKPVVVSDTSALPELVDHERSGILCPVGDVDAFVEAIRKLGSDLEYGNALGLEARRTIAGKYNKEKMIDSYERLYESLL